MRFVKVFLGLGLVAALAFAFIQPAHADPHAVFWTVVGQQQLFFNVLAALNQADYVESLDLRNQLLVKRKEAGFDKETSEASVTETKTDLANVLTRDVTLEGYDQETAQVERDFAVERSRRRNEQAVTQLLCQIAFGIEKCETENRDPVQVDQEKSSAVVTDPAKRDQLSFQGGVFGPINSSYDPGSFDQAVRQKIVQDEKKGEQQFPYLFSDPIAATKQLTQGDARKELLLNNVLARAENNYTQENFDVGFLRNIEFDRNGVAQINSQVQSQPIETQYGVYFATLEGLVGFSQTIQTEVDQKALQAKAFLAAQEANGFIGKAQQKLQPDGQNDKFVKDIEGIITVPAAVREAAAGKAIDSVVSAEQNLQYTAPESESTVSSTSAINPRDPNQAPSVPGLRAWDDNDPYVTKQFEAKYYGPQKEQQPGTLLKPIHLDDGSQALFRQLGFVASDKPGLNLGQAGTDFNQAVLNQVNR